MACQHPAQNTSTVRHGQPALTDILEKFWIVGHSMTTGHSVAWGTGFMWHSVARHSVAGAVGRLALRRSTKLKVIDIYINNDGRKVIFAM